MFYIFLFYPFRVYNRLTKYYFDMHRKQRHPFTLCDDANSNYLTEFHNSEQVVVVSVNSPPYLKCVRCL